MPTKSANNKREDKISEKLDIIIGLLAIQGKTKEEQIKILSSLKFKSKTIEKITGIPAGTVRRIRTTSKHALHD
jgi:ribosomal protein S11